MIPTFDADGFLPIGIHQATLSEFEQRFSTNTVRRRIFNGFLTLINDLKGIGCKNVFIDGSFVTTKEHPKDIDVCWDDRGADYDLVEQLLPILWDLQFPRKSQQLRYCADVFPAFLEEGGSGKLFLDFFQQIKGEENRQKGIIQITIT